MAAGVLVRDAHSNLVAAAHRDIPDGREYEIAFPLGNADEGDTAWERSRAYQIALLVGDGPSFNGATPATWMSDQILIRVGERSLVSIYHPPLPPGAGGSIPARPRRGRTRNPALRPNR